MSRAFSIPTYCDLLKGLARGGGSAKKLSLFLDFDGTLTPVAGHPDDAVLSESMREILISLNRLYQVAIISGRGLEDLKEKVGVIGLTYVGNHGMEMSACDFSFIYDIGQVESEAISQVGSKIRTLAASYQGTFLEEKGLTLSVHYRLLKQRRKPLFHIRLSAILAPFKKEGLIKITGGKGLVEIRPTADWDKGSALNWLMCRRRFIGTIPLCIGDDETDEDAFSAVKGRGLSIFVGRRESPATLFVPVQGEVEAMLAYIAGKGKGR